MTQSTNTFIRIKVGAKKYLQEVGGFVSGDKSKIFLYFEGKPDFHFENDNHPLSALANKLGATLYGGFEDEKNFYLVLPTKGLKAGDLIFYPEDNFRWVISYSNGLRSSDPRSKVGDDKPKTLNSVSIEGFLEDFKNGDCYIYNIFQEYARTGIIENDLYKQFFK